MARPASLCLTLLHTLHITLLGAAFQVPAPTYGPPALADHVNHYLSTGGHRALRNAFHLPPGVYYDPLRLFSREDIHPHSPRSASYSSDLALLRALTVHVPGVDPLELAAVSTRDDKSCSTTSAVGVIGEASEFSISYSSSTPSNVKNPVEFAVRQWANKFASKVRIRICFAWAQLEDSTLGAATSPNFIAGDSMSGLRKDALYSPAMASAIREEDVLGGDDFHVKMVLNNKVAWYLDVRSPAPFDQFDLATTVMHELAHGLFFSGTIKGNADTRRATFMRDTPGRFDQFLRVEDDIPVSRNCKDPKNLFNAVTNPTLRFMDGSLSFGMFSPGLFKGGSSVYHFDNGTLSDDCAKADISTDKCSDLMTHQLNMGYTQRAVGETTFRILKAMLSISGGQVGDASCDLPDSPLNSGATQENAVTAFTMPTWGIATVAVVAGIGAFLVFGVVLSSVMARKGSR